MMGWGGSGLRGIRIALVKTRFHRRGKGKAVRAGIVQIRGVFESAPHRRDGLMPTSTIRSAARANTVRAERVQDLLLISSFGFWAVLLGLLPVLALYGLVGG
jgi:hypothetical protein